MLNGGSIVTSGDLGGQFFLLCEVSDSFVSYTDYNQYNHYYFTLKQLNLFFL